MTSSVGDARVLAFEHAHTLFMLWRHPRANPEAVRRFQLRTLRVLLSHASANVAAYREHWSLSKLGWPGAATMRDFEALPTIGKDDLRGRPLAESLSDGTDPRRLVRHTTSGSSGEPFTIYRSPREEHLLNLFRLRACADAGLRTFDRIARFIQLPLDDARRGWAGRIRQAIGVHRDQRLDGLAPANEIIEQLSRQRPDVISGYPSTLGHVADALHQRGADRVWPRLVLCGGEVLGAAARHAIEDAFSAPVFDFYGAHEFNLLAWQCPQGDAYHVCDDSVLVEIVDDGGRQVEVGEVGEVIATALHSYTMPFIRYRTGDLAVRGPDSCCCGRPFSTLRAIQGRSVDYLKLPGGRRVHPYLITRHLAEREASWVSQHQIVQIDVRHVRLNMRAVRAPTSDDLERVRKLAAGILGADVRFEVALVDRFPAHPSGKFRPYLSQTEAGANRTAGSPR